MQFAQLNTSKSSVFGTSYPSFGMQLPNRHESVTDFRYGFNGMEKDDEVKGEQGTSYDFGNRIYDPRIGRFLTVDNYKERFPGQSPFSFAQNSPIFGIDINGDSLYILVHTSGNKRGDDMLKAAALTRKYDIESSKGFDSKRDKVIVLDISDLGKLEQEVETTTKTYSKNYGGTVEFGIFSHSALEGPTGGTNTSGPDAITPNQINVTGWGKIDFNWADNSKNRALFYGCRGGVYRNDKKSAFVQELSLLPNFKDVTLGGQSSYSFPSEYADYRSPSFAQTLGSFLPVVETSTSVGSNGNNQFTTTDVDKTYLVASDKGGLVSESAALFGVVARKMNFYKNGKKEGSYHQSGDKY
jgi:RHS repeat-associated protein